MTIEIYVMSKIGYAESTMPEHLFNTVPQQIVADGQGVLVVIFTHEINYISIAAYNYNKLHRVILLLCS